jgi:hypothetical protein
MIRNNVQIHDNGFVFCYDLGTTFTTNRSGVEILKMLQQGFDKERIRGHLNELFGLSDAEFEKDFQDFLVQLRNLRLLL